MRSKTKTPSKIHPDTRRSALSDRKKRVLANRRKTPEKNRSREIRQKTFKSRPVRTWWPGLTQPVNRPCSRTPSVRVISERLAAVRHGIETTTGDSTDSAITSNNPSHFPMQKKGIFYCSIFGFNETVWNSLFNPTPCSCSVWLVLLNDGTETGPNNTYDTRTCYNSIINPRTWLTSRYAIDLITTRSRGALFPKNIVFARKELTGHTFWWAKSFAVFSPEKNLEKFQKDRSCFGERKGDIVLIPTQNVCMCVLNFARNKYEQQTDHHVTLSST